MKWRTIQKLIDLPADQTPALGVALKHRRAQAERLRRDAADPEFHALDFDLDKNRIRAIRFAGKVDVISRLPTVACFGCVLVQLGSADQGDEGEVGVVLKEDRNLAR